MSNETKHSNEAILRDRLALDRTKLANERTFLAYLRTTLVLILSGVTIIKLFEIEERTKDAGMIVLACVLLVAGVVTGIVGTVRSLRTARRMEHWERQLEDVPPEAPPRSSSLVG